MKKIIIFISMIIAFNAVAKGKSPTTNERCSKIETADSRICPKQKMVELWSQYADKHTHWFNITPALKSVYSLNTYGFDLSDNDIRRVALTVFQQSGATIVGINAGSLFHSPILICTSVDCPISVRFDQGELKTFSTFGAGSSGMNIINTDSFLEAIRKSKRANIVLPLEDHGNIVFEFDVSGFDNVTAQEHKIN